MLLIYSCLCAKAWMLNVDQSPVCAEHCGNTKASPVAKQDTSMSTGLLIGTAPKAAQRSSAAKAALQKLGQSSAQGHPGINLGAFLSSNLPCPHKDTRAILNNP